MPAKPDIQVKRRSAIAAILRENAVTTQSDLVAALQRAGYDATQSSISRDLRRLGVNKSADGYRLPPVPDSEVHDLEEVAPFVRHIRPAGSNLVVLGTAIGAAQRVALALDRTGWTEMVGTLSGDDTIFVASASAGDTRKIVSRLNTAFKGR